MTIEVCVVDINHNIIRQLKCIRRDDTTTEPAEIYGYVKEGSHLMWTQRDLYTQLDLYTRELAMVPGIVELQFRSSRLRLPMEDLAATIQASRGSLESLWLSWLSLVGNETEVLCGSLQDHPSLKKVKMEHVKVVEDEDFWDPFISAVATSPHLAEFVLEFGEAQDKIGASLTDLCGSPTIKDLTLYNIPATAQSHCPSMFQALQGNRSLKSLIIQNMYVGIEDTSLHRNCGQMLAVNNTLERLEITSGGDLDTLTPILTALKSHNRSLKQLYFLHTGTPRKFPPSTIDALETMLKDNYGLEHINGHNLDLRPDARYYLKLNKAGRGRFLEEENRLSRKDWMDPIITNSNDTPVVFYFLSLNPSLCSGCNHPNERCEENPNPCKSDNSS